MKQVIVIRKDLNMPIGKACAQAAHASEKACYKGLSDVEKNHDFDIDYFEWRKTGATKICLAVKSLEELTKVQQKADELGIINSGLIVDEGRTIFEEPTATCLAIGPACNSDIDQITKRLRLY